MVFYPSIIQIPPNKFFFLENGMDFFVVVALDR